MINGENHLKEGERVREKRAMRMFLFLYNFHLIVIESRFTFHRC